MWKSKSVKYKEMAARGHRMVEKRCSIVAPVNNDLVVSQLNKQLEQERQLKADLNERVALLENRMRQSENNLSNRLAEEEANWKIRSATKETELRMQLRDMEDKILREKEHRIKVKKKE